MEDLGALLRPRQPGGLALDRILNDLDPEMTEQVVAALVWTGTARDVPRIERFVQGRELSGEQLQQIALFGHPAMWAFLAHFLSDEDLQDDAVTALTLLLGVGVSDAQRFQPGAWEAQLGRDAHTRYRLRKPFHTGSVQEEYQLRRVSYRALESRLDEMAIRTGTRVNTPLPAFRGSQTALLGFDRSADSNGSLGTQESAPCRGRTWY